MSMRSRRTPPSGGGVVRGGIRKTTSPGSRRMGNFKRRPLSPNDIYSSDPSGYGTSTVPMNLAASARVRAKKESYIIELYRLAMLIKAREKHQMWYNVVVSFERMQETMGKMCYKDAAPCTRNSIPTVYIRTLCTLEKMAREPVRIDDIHRKKLKYMVLKEIRENKRDIENFCYSVEDPTLDGVDLNEELLDIENGSYKPDRAVVPSNYGDSAYSRMDDKMSPSMASISDMDDGEYDTYAYDDSLLTSNDSMASNPTARGQGIYDSYDSAYGTPRFDNDRTKTLHDEPGLSSAVVNRAYYNRNPVREGYEKLDSESRSMFDVVEGMYPKKHSMYNSVESPNYNYRPTNRRVVKVQETAEERLKRTCMRYARVRIDDNSKVVKTSGPSKTQSKPAVETSAEEIPDKHPKALMIHSSDTAVPSRWETRQETMERLGEKTSSYKRPSRQEQKERIEEPTSKQVPANQPEQVPAKQPKEDPDKHPKALMIHSADTSIPSRWETREETIQRLSGKVPSSSRPSRQGNLSLSGLSISDSRRAYNAPSRRPAYNPSYGRQTSTARRSNDSIEASPMNLEKTPDNFGLKTGDDHYEIDQETLHALNKYSGMENEADLNMSGFSVAGTASPYDSNEAGTIWTSNNEQVLDRIRGEIPPRYLDSMDSAYENYNLERDSVTHQRSGSRIHASNSSPDSMYNERPRSTLDSITTLDSLPSDIFSSSDSWENDENVTEHPYAWRRELPVEHRPNQRYLSSPPPSRRLALPAPPNSPTGVSDASNDSVTYTVAWKLHDDLPEPEWFSQKTIDLAKQIVGQVTRNSREEASRYLAKAIWTIGRRVCRIEPYERKLVRDMLDPTKSFEEENAKAVFVLRRAGWRGFIDPSNAGRLALDVMRQIYIDNFSG